MKRGNISLYTENRTPVSLKTITLTKGSALEDIFWAVDKAINPDDMTDRLREVIAWKIEVDAVKINRVRYKIFDEQGFRYYFSISFEAERV